MAERQIAVTCVGCWKTGTIPAADFPPDSLPVCANCEPTSSAP